MVHHHHHYHHDHPKQGGGESSMVLKPGRVFALLAIRPPLPASLDGGGCAGESEVGVDGDGDGHSHGHGLGHILD